MKQRKNNRTAGFSLIEVVVGIAVLGLVTAPVCASLVLSVRLNSHSQALMNAQLQAAGVVETLLAEGIEEGTPNGTTETDGATVQVTADGTHYDVVVTSEMGGREVSIETSVRAVESSSDSLGLKPEGGDAE